MVPKVSEYRDWETRAVILRCSDVTFLRLLDLLRGLPECYLVYSKSSSKKLKLVEEEW